MADKSSQVAIFFDYDNQKVDPRIIFDYSENFGWIVKKRAYGDWVRDSLHRATMSTSYVELIDRPRFNLSDKKGNDISIAVDAMEVAFSKHNIDVFVFVTGDADFIPLVLKLKEYGKTVVVISSKNNTSLMLAKACDRFVFYENLVKSEAPPPLDHRDYHLLLARKAYAIVKNRGLVPSRDSILSIIKHFDPSFKIQKTGFTSVEAMIKAIEATWADAGEHHFLAGEQAIPAAPPDADSEPAKGQRQEEGAPGEIATAKQANIVHLFIQLFENFDLHGRSVAMEQLREYFTRLFPTIKLEKYDIRDLAHAVKLLKESGKFVCENDRVSYSRRYRIERGLRKMGIYLAPPLRFAIVKAFTDVYFGFSDEGKRTLNYLAREVYEKNKQEFSKNAIANLFTALKFTGIFEGLDNSSYITYSQPMKINCPRGEIEERLNLLYLKRMIKSTPVSASDFGLLSESLFGDSSKTEEIERLVDVLVGLKEISLDKDIYHYIEHEE